MAIRRVYLGHVDIGLSARLDLVNSRHQEASESELLQYLYGYGLIADQVVMQGSAPLKSRSVLAAYVKLMDAFRRNENHEPTPVFAFVKTEDAETYSEYLVDRLQILRPMGGDNAEYRAYVSNDAISAARLLDADLATTHIPRRRQSVSRVFRRSLLSFLRLSSFKPTGLKSETSSAAIEKINQLEVLQTFDLVKSLNLEETKQAVILYSVARQKYRESNAAAMEAINTDDSPVWSSESIASFLEAIGLSHVLGSSIAWSAPNLFKIRRIESFQALREEYFLSQEAEDIAELNLTLRTLRLDGRIRNAIRQSPASLAALVFETLNEAGIGFKSANKAAEVLTRTILSDAADEFYGQRCYRLFGYLDQLKLDLANISRSNQ